MKSTLGLLIFLFFVPSVAGAAKKIEPQKKPDLEDVAGSLDDEVSLLYSSQVQFSAQGIPLVTIGLMENQSQVSISSQAGLTIEGNVPVGQDVRKKTIDTLGRSVWRFEVAQLIKAKVSYWCAVESLPFNQRSVLDKAVRLWQKRGESVQIFEVGSVFGIGGQVIDNRTYILGIKAFETEKLAEEHAQKTFSRYGTRTFVHAHLDRRPAGTINMIDAAGRVLYQFRDLVHIRSAHDDPIRVQRVEYGAEHRWHGFEDRDFAESILITLGRSGGLVVVNRISVDRLLDGLVPAEIFPTAPMDALKAQAVVARGEVFAKIGTRHFLDPYLLCASTHCQVYSGVSAEKSRTSEAVRQTRGELLFKDAQLVDSVYSACCGGHSEDNDVVWADPPSPALRGKPDMDHDGQARWNDVSNRLEEWLEAAPQAYCSRSSFARPNLYRWEKTIDSKQVDHLVAETKPIGHVVSIQVLDRGVSGRVKVIRVVGTQGDLIVQREWPIRQLFGRLKSGMFVVHPIVDAEQMITGFTFQGGGWGHGVGMCQIGAIGMAEYGHDYRQVLAHYYGGARVYKLYGAQPGKPGKAPIELKNLLLEAEPEP